MPNTDAYKAYARSEADAYGIPQDLFVNLISAESSWNPNAVSPAGAEGIAQLMPGTASNINRFDPYASIHFAAQLLASYKDKFGTWSDALVAYNAGPGKVGQTNLPLETQNYVQKILGGMGIGGSPPDPTSSAVPGVGTVSATKIVFWSAAIIVGIIVLKGVSQ